MKKLLFILLLLCLSSDAFAQNKGVLLENLTWQEAEKTLKPETVVVIAFVLVAVALLACWIPARRATKVDPMIALRCD